LSDEDEDEDEDEDDDEDEERDDEDGVIMAIMAAAVANDWLLAFILLLL